MRSELPSRKQACCLLLSLFLIFPHVRAQNQYAFSARHNYSVKGVFPSAKEKSTLQTVLKELNRIKGVYFLYTQECIGNKMVDPVSDTNADIEIILDNVLANSGLKYKKIKSNTYVIVAEDEKIKSYKEYKTALSGSAPVSSVKITADPITGRVTGTDGTILSGVSIFVKGTKRGTTTDNSGQFTIAANQGETLVISYIGYQGQEYTVGSTQTVTISLAPATGQISEVVVTALGIRRERRSLGYSVTEVKGSDLTQAREINVGNSLIGRVPGLNVNSVAGGPGSSTNIIIRGISSLGGTNQPLYVINGIPVENTPNGQTGTQYDNGVDRGDAIGNINPDDIETISVLKGAAASALYGYRAKAGVILITTKSARGTGVDVNSNYVSEKIMDPTNWQYVYGQGANNIKPVDQLSAFQSGQSSWGGKLDGSSVVQFDGVSRPYIAQKNNLENFYRTGSTFTNTIAFNKTFTGGNIRFSGSNLNNDAVIPNSGLHRQSFNLVSVFNPIENLTIDARANYILEQAHNRPFLSDGAGNANFNAMFLPTSVDVDVLKKTSNDDGSEYSYSANTFATNPWFAAQKFINDTKRDRLISSLSVKYAFKNGLFLQGRVGRDSYNDRYTGVIPTGTAYRTLGQITEETLKFTDMNVDGLAGISIKAGDITITPNIGASYRRTSSEKTTNSGSEFAVPFVYNILNAKTKTVDYLPKDLEVQSVYGNVQVDIKSYLYLNGSVRSDWFSSLATPGVDNKLYIVYPSVSGSFVFSEFVKPGWMSFGKLRAGYAVVGQATDPYQTQLSYTFNSSTLNGFPLGQISNVNVPNRALMPSKASELEIGTEMRLFQNRVSLDVAWYNKKSKNEIIFAPASNTSGYSNAVLNIGELQNRGVEALVSVNIIKSKNFSWTSSINGAINNNKVLSLAADQSQLPGGTSRSGVGFTASIVGLPAAQVMAYDYQFDDSKNIVLDVNGIPARGNLTPYGSAYHKWIAGWSNDFSFKRFTLGFLVDGKWGGKIFSATDYYGYIFGLHKATLVNREGKFGNNIDAATYYSTLANNVSKFFVQDASFIKFRQLTFGYSFPAKIFGNKIQSLNLSIVGRNLFTIMKHTDNIDPEANFSSTPGGLTQGLELGGVPPVRTIGANLSVRF